MSFVQVEQWSRDTKFAEQVDMTPAQPQKDLAGVPQGRIAALAITLAVHAVIVGLLLSFLATTPARGLQERDRPLLVFTLPGLSLDQEQEGRQLPAVAATHSLPATTPLDLTEAAVSEWKMVKVQVPALTVRPADMPTSGDLGDATPGGMDGYDPYAGAVARRSDQDRSRLATAIEKEQLANIKQIVRDAMPAGTRIVLLQLTISASGWIQEAALLSDPISAKTSARIREMLIGLHLVHDRFPAPRRLRVKIVL